MKKWSYRSAAAGAVVWVGLVMAPLHPNYGVGTIEKLFLLAPLVIVPLGLRLTGPVAPGGRALLFAIPLVASFLFPQGWLAALLAAPWVVFTVWCGLTGLWRFWKGAYRDPVETCFAAALLFLPVGGMGLAQSRLGMTPLGYGEPVVLLVAVHFHYAAFVSPIMAGAVLGRMAGGERLKWLVAVSASFGSPILAAGYTLFVPAVRLLGATLLVVALFAVALLTLAELPAVRPRLAQVLLGISAVSVVAAMLYATAYAVADFFGTVWIAIPHMARTHGYWNALGFSLCGLAGWSLAGAGQERPRRSAALQSLTRRWM